MSQYMSSNNNNNMSKGAKIVLFFFELQLNIKLYHWTTESYSNHKTTNKLLDKLSDLIDNFVETYMGTFSRPVMKIGSNVPIQNMSKSKYIKLLKQAQDYLRGDLDKIISKNTELLSIRDEMLGEIDRALYLSTLS
jgi:DNA-binding ferritin-like protein